MILLLLVYYIGQATFADSRPIDGDDTFPPSIAARASSSSCPNAEHCRTTWNILWSCLATIFSCTWVAVHPNIPRPVNTRDMWLVQRWWHYLWEFLSNRMLLFIIALLVPEYILAWAIRQRSRAQEIARDHEDSNWTVTHGFFVIMGGFHLFEPLSHTPEEAGRQLQRASVADQPNSPISADTFHLPPGGPIHDPHEGHQPIRMLTESDLFRSHNDYQFIVPTEDEIKDQGKSDWLAKSFALVQTTWFLTQCIARGIQNLAITELEIVAGAYAMMNFAIYFFWWKKPLNIGCPVRVIDRQGEPPQRTRVRRHLEETALEYALHVMVGNQDNKFDWRRMPSASMFWSDCTDVGIIAGAVDITLFFGLNFGVIHCLAWPFSSTLWRISSVAMIAITWTVGLVSLWGKTRERVDLPIIGGLCFSAFLYISGRVITLTLAFTTLRSLPATAYETVQWTTFIPHV
ncbi:hypothetical protein DFH08DRAFT_753632 [Mycena albidolilacea]|uniref:Uncharacterized protein n=1 Tax=Mycena albidolilacea TaxID=1033008 RepID=A0AAD7EHH1_9AGAR|nr:hypothetical protein DFH08DRAFT_753632 [Mycena albidolilacea]